MGEQRICGYKPQKYKNKIKYYIIASLNDVDDITSAIPSILTRLDNEFWNSVYDNSLFPKALISQPFVCKILSSYIGEELSKSKIDGITLSIVEKLREQFPGSFWGSLDEGGVKNVIRLHPKLSQLVIKYSRVI